MSFKKTLLILLLLPQLLMAQMEFKSVGVAKPIQFKMGWQSKNGAFVWYKGQPAPIALKFKSLDIDSSEVESGQPYFYTYKFTEMYKGKATGEYGFTEWPRNVSDVYYKRFKDGKKFKFQISEADQPYDGASMLLLHGVQVHYYTFYENNLKFVFPNGSQAKFSLNKLNEQSVRQVIVADYNSDGVEDVAFPIMSYQGNDAVFDVFIYNKATGKFKKLVLPKNAACKQLLNVKTDKKSKQITTDCKQGNTSFTMVYKFNTAGELELHSKTKSH